MGIEDKREGLKTARYKFYQGHIMRSMGCNIVSILKSEGRVRICVDFSDLNNARSKDDFPLPHINILANNTTGHVLLSFMDNGWIC